MIVNAIHENNEAFPDIDYTYHDVTSSWEEPTGEYDEDNNPIYEIITETETIRSPDVPYRVLNIIRGDDTPVEDDEGNITYRRGEIEQFEIEFIESPEDKIAKLESETAATKVAARMTVTEKLDELDDITIMQVADLYDEWKPGEEYSLGEVRKWDGTVVRCLQGHTNNDPGHTPDTTPALWTVYRSGPAGDDYPVWEQPGSTNPYNATWDDGSSPVIVRYPDADGDLWENTHGDGNVWAPGAYGWAKL